LVQSHEEEFTAQEDTDYTMKKILLSPWLALLTLALVIGIRVADPAFVESIRLRYFDTLITSKAHTVSKQVHVVNIDDASIERLGQFPFPRSQYANIIEDLYHRNAGLVVFNIFMPDADRFGRDANLADSLHRHPVVLPQSGTVDKQKVSAFRPGVSEIGTPAHNFTVDYPGIQPNIQLFNSSAAGIGVVNVLPEIDGVTRRIPMVVSSGGLLYPSVSLETLRVAVGDPSFQIKSTTAGIEAVRIPKFAKIQTDAIGRIWVDWSSDPIEHSLVDLPGSFNGGIVIVGLTARGLNNPVATPRGGLFPHYVQASVLDTLTSGTSISRPDWVEGAEILGLVLLSIIAIFLTRWTYGFILFFGLLYAVYAGSRYVYAAELLLVDVSFPIFALTLVYVHSYTVKFITELNAKLQIKKQFGTYLSPDMVEKLQRNPELLRLGGETRKLSIMFTDVRGFTTISEHYGKDVQGLTRIMNRYMTAMTAKIIDNNGTLDKYIGDAQMAFWNAPLDDADHAKNAVRTGLSMLEDLDEFNKEIALEGIPAFGMGLGINTADVVVGNMGSSQRFDYTCLGDGVNLASRLEGQSKGYGVRIILGPETAQLVRDEFPVVELDNIAVKGKTEGVKIYTVGTTMAYMHNEYLKEYYRGNWDKATTWARKMLNDDTVSIKHYYELMIERMSEGLPANWDGTYRATSK
jgi:adenylate cyclase